MARSNITQDNELDRRIDFVERKVLLIQDRIIKQRDRAGAEIKRLDRSLKGQEEIKKEWIKKINTERERIRDERNDAINLHRLMLDDMRLKYDEERQRKLQDVKALIRVQEEEIRQLQQKRDEVICVTKAQEADIQANYQTKINETLREEQTAMRTGVVRQKRLLDAPNIYSMALEKSNPVGMKRRATAVRRAI